MRVVVVTLALLVALPGPAHAADVVINNGLSPPNPANVIDDATYSDHDVYVRNVGCPPGWPDSNPYDTCPSPGDPTEVRVADGGAMQDLYAYDSSIVTLSGGSVSSLFAVGSSTLTMSGGSVVYGLGGQDNSTVTLSGGEVGWQLLAANSCTITMSGGVVSKDLYAYHSSTITIVGRGFEVDGNPQPYGDLSAQSGRLTGTLASGDPIDNVFHQGGGSYTGTITLVAGPLRLPALSPWGKLTLAVALFAFGLVGIAARRRYRVR